MVVVQHVFVGLHVELVVVHRVLAERDRCVLVHDPADLSNRPGRQLAVVLEPDDLYFLPVGGLHEECVVLNAVDPAHESDGLANKTHDVGDADERVRLAVHVLDLFCHSD